MTDYSEQNFLDSCFEDMVVSIHFLCGVKYTTVIRGSDEFTILVDGKNGEPQIIYKHAISTISKPVSNKA